MYSDPFGGPPWWVNGFIVLVFGAILSLLVYVVARAIVTGIRNSAAPHLERSARIISRRGEVWGTKSRRTSYYLTFEFPDGTREEFQVSGHEFGLLTEGDTGLLRSQGTWFKGFDRQQI